MLPGSQVHYCTQRVLDKLHIGKGSINAESYIQALDQPMLLSINSSLNSSSLVVVVVISLSRKILLSSVI